ncbi:peptide deformylase [Bifidobacterium sp. ESL0690]|uniref:peptide deformylase n=1 Tax=Bifidobacterium sp. ESL0690 TaxID=2983214 RepID=UPI0023F9B3AF|nr:peptide deformylase [Bifidobacterium sp. ESL0690]WEV47265.1 peptide deformylase [Bifidobacterium sp. ESL0690]
MQQPIVTSTAFLSQSSAPATLDDLDCAQNLKDTLEAHADKCVGMAANMIGERKQIIVFNDELTGRLMTMFNPEIIEKEEPYQTEEGCLSLESTRKTTRFQTIRVHYQDRRFKERTANFSGWTAQIIQHEIDHCNGILI